MTKVVKIVLLSLILSLSAFHVTNAQTLYPHRFAPLEGKVTPYEKGVRNEICLNGYWDFQPVSTPKTYVYGSGVAPELTMPTEDGWDKTKIKIPSPWNVNAFARYDLMGPDHRTFPSYPKEWEDVQMGWLRRYVDVPSDWEGDNILLHFDAVAGETVVMVNGKEVGKNFDLFMPFTIDVTDYVTPGQRAEILVGIRSQKLFEDTSTVGRRIVPAGSMWGYLINGIWQDVYLLAQPKVNIANIYVKPLVSKDTLEVDVKIANTTDRQQNITLISDVCQWINRSGLDVNSFPEPNYSISTPVLTLPSEKIKIPANDTITVILKQKVGDRLDLWTPESPNLYMLKVELKSKDSKSLTDRKSERFGWREWTIDGTQHCLNGKPYPLRGDSWHFMGVPQMTPRYAYAWFRAIKDMNGNAVRLHAQPYPSFYLDMADEMGICVLDETANWASDGGPKLDSDIFWDNSRSHLERVVLRDRNHPSVMGWSISNENKPVILYVFNCPDLMPGQKQAWVEWRDIVRANDNTRPWISSDGEEDGEGILPVTVGHYGDSNAMQNWKGLGKPWGVGEHSMAYYGTPEQVSVYNGERSYESMQGRMEGIANEAYNLIASQRDNGASYSTVFNMVWYGLQPLPLGKKDTTTPVSMQEGIFFPEYVEGIPGMQPERIGPYSSTLNPGYDPTLPLYKPWPMFDAMRAANSDDAPAWSPWSNITERQPKTIPHQQKPFDKVVFIGSYDSPLRNILENQGVSIDSEETKISVKTSKSSRKSKSENTLYIVDASQSYEDQTYLLTSAINDGQDVWFWGITPQTEEVINQLTGISLTLIPLQRSSFIPKEHWLMNGLKNSDFYFCAIQKDHASNYTLSGEFVDGGEVVLEACRTDWRRWNNRPEEYKTAAVLRSENECTPQTSVIVRNGNVIVSTLDNFANSEKGFMTLRTMLKNLGVAMTELEPDPSEIFFSREGELGFPKNSPTHFVEDRLTVYVFSPRALDDLLIEPDMPKLSLVLDGQSSLIINGKEHPATKYETGRMHYDELPLQQGWNCVEIIMPSHENFTAAFTCDNRPEFVSKLKASFNKP